jgi:6-phosphogluconate dehydrogenase
MYVCGPTVYNFAHIGNFRPVVVFDLLFRVLRRLYGEDHVVYAANVTDVDDKINQKAAAEGVPITAITEAVYARALSGRPAQRAAVAKVFNETKPQKRAATPQDIEKIRDALYASKIIAYAQGFEQLAVASKEYDWNLNPGLISTIWRGGCIIRAAFLDRIREGYEAHPDAPSLLLQSYFRDAVLKAEPAWRDVVVSAVRSGIAVPAFASSLAYFDGLRRARGPANQLQGLRDYFGAHTYRRIDKEGSYHIRWSQDGTEVKTA